MIQTQLQLKRSSAPECPKKINCLSFRCIHTTISSESNDTSLSHKNGWTMKLWVQNPLDACVIDHLKNIYVHTNTKSTSFLMSSSSNGTPTPCKSKAKGKVEGQGEVMGSSLCMYNLQIKNK